MTKLKDFKLKDLKLKSLILNNLALKIVAIIVAAMIWVVVVNIDDPSQRTTITGITVEIINEDALTDMGYIYEIQSGSTISISVRAPRSVAEELRSSDFYAYADFSQRDNSADTVDIHVSCVNEDIMEQVNIVSQTSDFIQLAVDNRIEKEVEVSVNISGTPADGYVVGSYSISPTTISVSGPEKTVSRITSAVLNYDVSSMTASINDYVVPVFYDEDGNLIDSERLELNRPDVQLSIEILPTKWVTVNYVIIGEPASGYEVVSTESNLTSVNIAGTRAALDAITSIDIKEGDIDITDAEETVEISVPLTSYLPSGYKIVSAESNLVVTIGIESTISRTISIPISEIQLIGENAAYEYTIEYSARTIPVRITGLEEIINAVTVSDLTPTISVAGLTEGTHSVKINITHGDDYNVSGSYSINVVVSERETEPATDSEGQTEQGTTDSRE